MNIIDEILENSNKNIFVLQQYSMRSHITNEYNILQDGNLNLTLHRLYQLPSDYNVIITVPVNCNGLDSIIELTDTFNCSIRFEKINYGTNAQENRDVVPMCYVPDDFLLISDFCKVTHHNTIFTFNISKVNGLDRPIDKFITNQQAHDNIYVLNENQTELLPAKVQDKILDGELLNKIFTKFITKSAKSEVHDIAVLSNNYTGIVFFPFRISDEVYQFSKVHDYCKEHNVLLVITDPNESNTETENIYVVKSDKKEFYCTFLTSEIGFKVICHEDVFTVLHQSIIEIVHYIGSRFIHPNNLSTNYLNRIKELVCNRI